MSYNFVCDIQNIFFVRNVKIFSRKFVNRKRKLLSRRYEEDSREAREAVRQLEWCRSISEKTSFDEHLRKELERINVSTKVRDRENVFHENLSWYVTCVILGCLFGFSFNTLVINK